MKKTLIFVLALFMCVSIYAKGYEVTFSGENIQSREIGILISTDKEKKLVAVTSPVYNYAFILPYQENWVFEKNDQYYLFGHNENMNISINIYKIDEEKDETYLGIMKENLLQNKDQTGTETADLISLNGVLVLKTMVDAGKASKMERFKDVKQQNLFITKTNGKARFVLHFSLIMNNSNQQEIDTYLKYITKSFKVDFMLK